MITADAPDTAEAADYPVRQAYYRDPTGNGDGELILGVERPAGSLTIRVYTCEDGRVLRIMNDTQRMIGVEVTARDLILRSRCAHLRVLAPRLTEITRNRSEPGR